MASQVTGDGDVLPPMNISAPAPILNLRGFKWRTVDEKILGPQPKQDREEHESQLTAEETSPSTALEASARAAAAPAATLAPETAAAAAASTALPAPQLPLSAVGLPTQLPAQLGSRPGLPGHEPPPFPLTMFQGAYAGNGFNMIFRPRPRNDTTKFPSPPQTIDPDDNILELNLTTEQLTFGSTIGHIPNRGLNLTRQEDITLEGLPYLQTIQDVTNIATGKGDNPALTGIHFEPGMWLFVPKCNDNPKNAASVVRMASIPHGTTINAQGLVPDKDPNTHLGGDAIPGVPGDPKIFDLDKNKLDTTPFRLGHFDQKQSFENMEDDKPKTRRIPQDLERFRNAETINTGIIKNPNLVLKNAISGQDIREIITFTVTTGPGPAAGPETATLNGGGTTNISFLAGSQGSITTASPGIDSTPNAHADFMTSRFWIETVAYKVRVPRLTTRDILLLKPTMDNSFAPTPTFAVTPPPSVENRPMESKVITIPGIQIQYSQTVHLNFGPRGQPSPTNPGILTWPHVSVATLVPSDPQPFTMSD